jgi:hypothetical protein
MKYVDIRDLPPCSFSPQCLRLLDELDALEASASGRLAYIEDLQEKRRLRQLRSHLANCPTCSALLAEARRTRTQQRVLLYHFLHTNERRVPSTSQAIIEAMRREKAQEAEKSPQRVRTRTQNSSLFVHPVEQDEVPVSLQARASSRSFQHRNLFQNILTLATVAAVILAAVGLLNRFSDQPTSAPTNSNSSPLQGQQPEPRGPTVNNYGWDTVLVGLTMLSASGMVKGFTFYGYDASTSKMKQLVSSTQVFLNVNMDGISHDGQSLLYDTTFPDRQTTYSVYSPAAGQRNIYWLPAGEGGNAIWMDSSHILVQEGFSQVVELDTRNGTRQRTWPLKASRLAFYRQPFLYFIGAENLIAGALYRMNLSEASAEPHYITNAHAGSRFWLSIDGTTLFYANKGASGKQGIYAMNSDGTNVRLLRAGPALPIGYADDNALMVLQQVGERLEVIQMGATPAQPERVVFTDAAPGAISLCSADDKLTAAIAICDGNIALEPYGHGLLLHAYYANGSHSLVYDNLVTGSSRTILSLPVNASVQLPGWSKMSIAPVAMHQATCLCA